MLVGSPCIDLVEGAGAPHSGKTSNSLAVLEWATLGAGLRQNPLGFVGFSRRNPDLNFNFQLKW